MAASTPPADDPPGSRMRRGARAAAAIGLLAHVAVGAFPYAMTGLLAPPWAVAALGLVWVGLLALAVVLLRRRRGWAVLAIAPAALAVWVGVVSLGDALLGWTA